MLSIGWAWPPLLPSVVAVHGPLMVCSFLHNFSLLMGLAGDMLALPARRRWGALLNGTAILFFFLLVFFTIIRSQMTPPGKKETHHE